MFCISSSAQCGLILSAVDFKAAYGTEMLTADSYGTLSYDDIDKNTTDVFYAYQAAKTAADKDAWELVRGTPDVDLTASK